MKNYFTITFVLLIIGCTASAQTKRIAMRSHSSTRNITVGSFDNWGLPPEYTRERRRREDSIRKAWEYRKRQDSLLNEKLKRDSLRKNAVTLRKVKIKKVKAGA